MSKENYRTIGAVIGLTLGIALTIAVRIVFGHSSMISGALFGAGGAVAGGISGEQVHAWRRRGS
jgi:hypothetical protein